MLARAERKRGKGSLCDSRRGRGEKKRGGEFLLFSDDKKRKRSTISVKDVLDVDNCARRGEEKRISSSRAAREGKKKGGER